MKACRNPWLSLDDPGTAAATVVDSPPAGRWFGAAAPPRHEPISFVNYPDLSPHGHANTRSAAPQNISPAPETGKSQTHGTDAEIRGELDQRWRTSKLTGDAHPHNPQEIDQPAGRGLNPKKGLRGPRVVHAGREHRTGIVVSVGPSDLFVEFGPKELGVVDRNQWKEGGEAPQRWARVR